MAETTRKRLGELTRGVFAVLVDLTDPLPVSQVLKLVAERVPPEEAQHVAGLERVDAGARLQDARLRPQRVDGVPAQSVETGGGCVGQGVGVGPAVLGVADAGEEALQQVRVDAGIDARADGLVQGGSGLIYRVPIFINGKYWGLYATQERPEANFGQNYLGGDEDNFDVVKSAGGSGGYNTEATDGTMSQGTSATPGSAWARLWWRARELRADITRYLAGHREA